MKKEIYKSYQVFYKNNYSTEEFFTTMHGGYEQALKIANSLKQRYDEVRIVEQKVITRTIRVFA